MTLDDLPFDYPTPATNNGGSTRKCRRHEWATLTIALFDGNGDPLPSPVRCMRCESEYHPERARRGRTNRSRGNAIEREVGKKLGLRRVGQYGGPDDLSGELFAAQVKSGGAFSERYWAWLKAVPANAGQTPLLVVTDAPGPGRRRRAVVVLDLDEWIALHGPTEGVAE